MKHWLEATFAIIVYRLWAYWLKRTQLIAANTTLELLKWGYERLFKKEKKNMFEHVIQLGDAGQLIVSEAKGVAKLEIKVGTALGGGEVAGVLKASAGASVELGAMQLIDLGFKLAADKFPALAPLIKAAQAAVDAELLKG